jgi:hypothetical protein
MIILSEMEGREEKEEPHLPGRENELLDSGLDARFNNDRYQKRLEILKRAVRRCAFLYKSSSACIWNEPTAVRCILDQE